MVKTKKTKHNNPVCAVMWLDAMYSFDKEYKKDRLHPQLTTGFVMEANDEFLNLATNVNCDPKTGELWPVDGFVIPKKAILKFVRLKNIYDGPKTWQKK